MTCSVFRPLLALGLLCFVGCSQQQEPLSADQLLEEAWSDFRFADYELAIRKFDKLVQEELPDKTREHELQASFGLATLWDLRMPLPDKDPELATALYRKLIEEEPQHDLAAWSRLALARMEQVVTPGEQPDLDATRAAYRELIQHHPDHPAGQEARIHLAGTYFLEENEALYQQSIEEMEAFLKAYPDSPWISHAHGMLIRAHLKLGNLEAARNHRLEKMRTEEFDPTNPKANHAWNYRSHAVQSEFDIGDLEEARTYYRKLIEEYPTDMRTFWAKEALKRIDRLEQQVEAELLSEAGLQ